MEYKVLPDFDAFKVRYYWKHMAAHSQWAKQCGDWTQTSPMFLWGDDAEYDKQRRKVVAVACGFVLDDEKSSFRAMFPLI